MGANGAVWRFPHGGYSEIKGINDAGVETFTSHTLSSFVRESLQNSLDAATGDAVHVVFDEFDVPVEAIPDSAGLQEEVLMCLTDGGDTSATAKRVLNGALSALERPTIRVMRVSDHGTSGLRGAGTSKTGTDWSRLIKESGASGKQDTSGGSYGIGKYASFACSALRTVIFSSLDDTGIGSHVGVSRLISRLVEPPSLYTSGIGYFSDSEQNNAVMGQLHLPGFTTRSPHDPGTDILVLGFQAEGDVTRQIVNHVLCDFLVAIWRGGLTVDVCGTLIDRGSLGRHISDLNAHDADDLVRETIEHYDLLTSTDPTRKVIEFRAEDLRHPRVAKKYGWVPGSATLYLKKGADTLNRAVMMTRAAGMRIFNQKGISSTIHFTGILMITGEAMNRDFKEMEEPSHTQWVPARAADPKLATNKYKALREWVRDMVLNAYADTVGDEVEAYGTASLIPRIEPREEGSSTSDEETLSSTISEVRRTDTTPKRDVTPPQKVEEPDGDEQGEDEGGQSEDTQPSGATEQVDVDYDHEGDAIRKGEGPAQGGGSEPIRGAEGGDDPGFRQAEAPLPRLRRVNVKTRLMCVDRPTRTYRLTFVVPHDAMRAVVGISAVGEIGSEGLTLTWADATVGGRRGCSVEGASVTIEGVRAGERATIEFRTAFPHYCMMEADYHEAR